MWVTFTTQIEPEDCEHLTDEQWLKLIGLVGNSDPRWAWSMPAEPGQPVRVLAPDETIYRIDADGTPYRERSVEVSSQ